ncbi:MAG: hypothetical protein JNM63_05790, partial [Spirochaetia bacterium]|nr:hypothetical protein [Spirochaetia bacterium]
MDRVFHELRDQLVEKLSRMEDEASSRHGSAMAMIRALENEAETLEKTQKEKLDQILIPQLKQVEKVYVESRDLLAKKGQTWVESLRDEHEVLSEQLAEIRQSYEDKVASEEKSLAEYRSDFRGKFQDRIKEEVAEFSKDLKSKKEGLDQISKEWKELQNVKREELKRIEDWNRHLSKQEQSVLEMTERFKLRIGGLEKDFVQYKEASKKDLLIVIGRFQEECRNDLRAMQALEVRKTSKEIGGIKALMSKRLARLDEDLAGLLRKKEKAWEQLEERIGDQMVERGREFSAELSRIREEMKRVEADRKQIFVSLEKLPSQYQGEVRKALDRESEGVRVELIRIGKDLGIEAERQIAESGRRAASELEKEKLVLRESFARMGQSLGEDRELFQNRLIQYRRELEESMKEMLDESRESAREIENKKALIEAYFRGGDGEGATAQGSAPVSLVQWKSELASGFEKEWEGFRDSVHREMDQVRTALKSLSVKKDQRYEVFQHELEQSLASYQKKLSQIGHRFDELEGKIEEK